MLLYGESEPKNENLTLKVIIDFLFLSIGAAYIPFAKRYLKTFQRGYFCDDEEIMYPNKENTISERALYCFGILAPISLIVLTEVIWSTMKDEISNTREVFFCGLRIPFKQRQIYLAGRVYLFGFFVTAVSTSAVKHLAGRLRPNFLELCQPDFNCSEIHNPNFYVENYICTNTELANKDYSRHSFPSGHTSISFYAMIFSVLHIQARVTFTYSALLKPIFQFILLLIAAYISLTRIRDNQHHADDVAAGFILGLIICLIVVFTQTDFFKPKETSRHQRIT